jgi:hypothetical protein
MRKNIALFLDGSWKRNDIDGESNVSLLHRMACEAPVGDQISHYISGVGTERMRYAEVNELRWHARLDDESTSSTAKRIRKYLGGTTGFGIGSKIKEAYAFLVANYNEVEQDRVYIFGFSRGAFAARSLAAFVNEVGLLLRNRLYLVPEAYEIYRSGQGREFLEKYLQRKIGGKVALGENPIPVYLVGVWDTVSALGFPKPFDALSMNTDHHKTFEVPSNVSHARHALALHEMRILYPPSRWKKTHSVQDLVQVWFAGAHADVGGGYPEKQLSDIPLLWMARQAQDLLLLLDTSVIKFSPNPYGKLHQESKLRDLAFGCEPRELLESIANGRFNEESASYFVHPSAVMRVLTKIAFSQQHKFSKKTNAKLDQVDDLTLKLASQNYLRAEEFPPHCEPQIIAFTRSALVDAMFDFAQNAHSSTDILSNAILMNVFSEDLGTVAALENALQKFAEQISEEVMRNPTAAMSLMRQFSRVLEGLRDIVSSMTDGAIKRHLHPFIEYRILEFAIENHPDIKKESKSMRTRRPLKA